MKKLVVVAVAVLQMAICHAGQRVVCHYDTIEGRVGQELRKPNGDYYFDVDWFDFDSAPVQGHGDGDFVSFTGEFPGFSISSYKQDVEKDPIDKDGKDSPSWYHPGGTWYPSGWSVYTGPYCPFVATPTQAGTYNFSMTFEWSDGYTESINIKFIIREKGNGTWYVNGASGSDANYGDEASSAKETIQAAIDVALAGDTILVAPGTYDAVNTQGKDITIRSTDGAEQTKIVGRTSGGVNDYGEVTAAMLISEETFGEVGDSSDPDYEEEHTTYKYDVVNEWSSWTPMALPCSALEGFTIEVNSVAEDDQVGVVGGHLKNCRLICADGVKKFNLVQLAVIENSLIKAGDLGVWIDENGNEDGDVEVLSDCILRNCTVYTGSMVCASEMENTIIYARNTKVYLDEEGANKPTLSNCVFYNVKGVSGRAGVTVADPKFANAASGDFHLVLGSPCIDKGGTSYGTTDLAGNPRVVNGKIDVGCYEYQNDEPDEPTVSATAANVAATYDGAAHGIAVSVSAPTSGVTVEYALAKDGPWQAESFSFTEVCAATQVWYRALAEGYLGVTNVATVTVSPRSIQNATVTVTPAEGGYKYDGTAKEPAVSVTDSFSGFTSSDYSVSYSGNVNAGTAKVVVTGAGHYAGTVEKTFVIAPRALTFTSASAEWAWDGAAHSCETAPVVTGDGFVGADGATFFGFASVTAPGTYENTFSYAFTSGTVASNYSVSQVCGKLCIFNYKASVKADGTVKIDGLGDEPLGSSELAIPEKIDGKPVTEIAEKAFVNSTCGATTLKLSKYCKKIGASAFRGIKTLKVVTFVKVYETDDVTEAELEIGAYAFGSTALESIGVPSYVRSVGDYAFSNCGNLKRVAVAAGTTVSDKAFYRSGITAGAKPEVISMSTFSVSGGVATMKVSGTGGSIDVSGLKVRYSLSLGSRAEWTELAYRVGETVLTDSGCEVTIAVDVPDGVTSVFFSAELVD